MEVVMQLREVDRDVCKKDVKGIKEETPVISGNAWGEEDARCMLR